MVRPSLEHTIDEFLLLQVIPRFANIDFSHQPTILSQDFRHYLIEVLCMSSIRVSNECRIIVEDDTLILEILVIITEVLSEFWQLALILDIE